MPREASPWRATGRETPVFLDERGRRGLLVRALGAVGALASAGALTLLVTGVLAFMHLTPIHVGGQGLLISRGSLPHQSPPRYAMARQSSVRLEVLVRDERPEVVNEPSTPEGRRQRL